MFLVKRQLIHVASEWYIDGKELLFYTQLTVTTGFMLYSVGKGKMDVLFFFFKHAHHI